MNSEVSVDVDMMEHLPAKTLLRLVERQQSAKKWLAAFTATVNTHTAMFRRFEELDIEPRFNLEDGDINISFTGNGEMFGEVWGELRRAGFKCESRPKKGDTSFSGFFEQPGFARLWLYFTSSVCRQVKVGTRTVEQPIYETRCGEELPQVEDATPSAPLIPPSESPAPAEESRAF